MRFFIKLVLCFALLIDVGHAATSQLNVGLINIPPFSYVENNQPKGIMVDIWQKIAENQHLAYRYTYLDQDFDKHIQELTSGKYDLLIGPLFITANRVKSISFSEPLFVDPTLIIAKIKPITIGGIFSKFIKTAFIGYLLIYFFIFMFHVSHYYYVERNYLPHKSKKAIANIIWAYLITGKHDLSVTLPQSFYGKLSVVFWRFSALIFVSLLISSFSAVIITAKNEEITSLSQLKDKKIAGIAGSQTERNVQSRGIYPIPVKNLEEGINLLLADKIDGLISDKIASDYYIGMNHMTMLHTLNIPINYNFAAYALQNKDEALRKKINIELTTLQENGYTSFICKRYLGLEDMVCIGN